MTDADAVGETSRDFTLQGQRRDDNTIFLKLRIADPEGWCLILWLLVFMA